MLESREGYRMGGPRKGIFERVSPTGKGVALLGLFTLLGFRACDRYTVHDNAFDPLKIEVTAEVTAVVHANGHWTLNRDGSSTSGPQYAIAVYVYGTAEEVALSNVRFVDVSTGAVTGAYDFAAPVRIPEDEAWLLFDWHGTILTASPKRFRAELTIGESTHPMEGQLVFEYRRKRASRIWSALMGV